MSARRRARAWRELSSTLPKSRPQIRKFVGNDQIDVMLDNIGLPYSGINIALERLGDRRSDGRRDPDLARTKSMSRRPSSSPCCAASCRERFAETAVLLPARRYRRSGAQFRPAGAHRCAHFRPEPGRGVRAGLEDRALPERRSPGSSIRTCSKFRRAGPDGRHGSHARAPRSG